MPNKKTKWFRFIRRAITVRSNKKRGRYSDTRNPVIQRPRTLCKRLF